MIPPRRVFVNPRQYRIFSELFIRSSFIYPGRDAGRHRRPGSLEALRERNRTLVLAALRRGGGVSRAELARRTGLSRSTISTVVADLVAAGIASEAAAATPDGVGRPGVPVTLNAAAGAAVGIAVGPPSAASSSPTSATPCWPRRSRARRPLALAGLVDAVAPAVDGASRAPA